MMVKYTVCLNRFKKQEPSVGLEKRVKEERQLISGPSALGWMSLLMCVCTGNGTVVRGHRETGENIMENRPQSGSGEG